MINGRYDSIFSLDANVRPMQRLLGTSEKDKKLFLSDGGHAGRLSNSEVREILDWLDRYLGPVVLK